MKKAFVLGSINVDYVVETSEWPKIGESLFGDSFLKNPGGKGANQAVALSKQDIETNFIGCVGNDLDGKQMIETLKKYHINTENILIVEETTGKAFITVCDDNNQIIVIKGANQCITKEQIDKALESANEGDFFLTQYEVEPHVVRYGLTKAKEKGLITVVNPSPVRVIKKDLYQYIDYLVLNEIEAKDLTGIDYIQNPYPVFKYFSKFGVKETIVTLGPKGCDCLASGIAIDHQPGFKVDVVDTTAAGDTFLGAFVSAVMRGKLTANACVYANRAGSLACTKLGAQRSIPSKKEVEENQ